MRTRLMTLAFLLSTAPQAFAAPPKMPQTKVPQPKPPAETRAPTLFDKLKPLAGTWVQTVDGKEVVALQSRLTSGGSVLLETMFPGAQHEMTNAYHMDGDKLVVTHYCAMGNQPRLQAMADKAGAGDAARGVLHFTLRDATNVDVKTGRYMGELTLTIRDADHIVQEWKSFQGDKADAEIKRFELTRKK